MIEAVLDPALQSKLRIPPRPEVVSILQEEMRKEFADLARIGRAIGADVGLAGAMLRTVNSPAFGLSRKVSAVGQAILWHHDIEVFNDDSVSGTVRNHIGIIHLAEHIQHLTVRDSVDLEWVKFEDAVLRHFALTEEDFINLLDDARDLLLVEN